MLMLEKSGGEMCKIAAWGGKGGGQECVQCMYKVCVGLNMFGLCGVDIYASRRRESQFLYIRNLIVSMVIGREWAKHKLSRQ